MKWFEQKLKEVRKGVVCILEEEAFLAEQRLWGIKILDMFEEQREVRMTGKE